MPSTGTRGLAWKRISAVEVDIARSRQHEFHAGGLRTILGKPMGKDTYPASYHYWRPEHPKPVTAHSTFTFYDARENIPSRTELRLYYQTNTVTSLAGTGDLFLIELPWRGFSKVHIIQNGSPRCSSIAARLSQIGQAKANVLKILSPDSSLAATNIHEVLQLVPSGFIAPGFEQDVEDSTIVANTCQKWISTGERPSQSQVRVAVKTIQSAEWPGESWDETVSKRMFLERHIRQEIEVQRLRILSKQNPRTTKELRTAVQISSTQLRASDQHLKQAFVDYILDVLEESLGPMRVKVDQPLAAGAVVRIQEKRVGSAETVVLVSTKEALQHCMAAVQVKIDWLLTDTFPVGAQLQQLVSTNTDVKIATVRSVRASPGPDPAIWGPDLDDLISCYSL